MAAEQDAAQEQGTTVEQTTADPYGKQFIHLLHHLC